jgi:hypothetical protein
MYVLTLHNLRMYFSMYFVTYSHIVKSFTVVGLHILCYVHLLLYDEHFLRESVMYNLSCMWNTVYVWTMLSKVKRDAKFRGLSIISFGRLHDLFIML